MSDSSISLTAAGFSYYGLLGELVLDSQTASQNVDLLTQQTASGLISPTYSGLGSNGKLALDLSSEIGHDNTWEQNITQADSMISITQNVMNQIGTIASNMYNLTDTLLGPDPSAIDDVAGQAKTALQEVAGLLDSTDAGNYIFAGIDTGNPPVPNPQSILTSGFYTQINTAVTALATNGAAATAASTLAVASSDASGTTPFSSTISSTRTTVTIANNQPVQVGLLANANAEVTSSGVSTGVSTGSYMRDLLRSLATIASMSSTQANLSDFGALVADTQASLSSAMTAMDNEEGILGDTQAQIDATGTILSQTTLSLTAQLSNVTDADLATVATKLSAAQTQLTASYKMISALGTLSLVNYI
jgi:flagellar hook-associated protein 3 FlgL